MQLLEEYLSQKHERNIHSSQISKELAIEEIKIKNGLLQLKKEKELDFDYLTGWVTIPHNQIEKKYDKKIKIGKRLLIFGLIATILLPPIGILFSFAGFYIILQAKLDLKDEEGKEIDLVGAGVIMNAIAF